MRGATAFINSSFYNLCIRRWNLEVEQDKTKPKIFNDRLKLTYVFTLTVLIEKCRSTLLEYFLGITAEQSVVMKDPASDGIYSSQ